MTLIHVFKRLYPGSHRVTAPTWIIDSKNLPQDSWSASLSQTSTHLCVAIQNIPKPEGYH